MSHEVQLYNEKAARFADIIDALMTKYPGRNIVQIMQDAADFCGPSYRDIRKDNNTDLLNTLVKYYHTHD